MRVAWWPIVAGAIASIGGVLSVTQATISYLSGATVQTWVVRQASDGVTNENLSEDYVEKTRDFLVQHVNSRAPDSKNRAKGSSYIIKRNSKRLGVIKIIYGNVTPMITVLGINNKQLVRVTCGISMLENVDYEGSICSNALKQEFGISL